MGLVETTVQPRIMDLVGVALELRYEHPAVCDTWVGVVVERMQPRFVLRVLVLDDPLRDFARREVVYSTESKLREWIVKELA